MVCAFVWLYALTKSLLILVSLPRESFAEREWGLIPFPMFYGVIFLKRGLVQEGAYSIK